MSLLQPFGPDIWIADGPIVQSARFAYPTRMAIMRLDDGALFVWSPIAINTELRAALDAHGAHVTQNARAFLTRAFDWL